VAELVDILRRLPSYIRLVWALLRDGRVPWAQKLILAGILGYIVLPIDLVPDVIPVLGQLDDIAVILLGLDLFIRSAPQDIVDEHLARIAQDKDQLARDIATADRLLGDRLGNVRGTLKRVLQRNRRESA
jgi:uncharacterized membrane protein YkvA (DUF1232 family)